MPSTGESLPAVPAGPIVLLHSSEKRRSVALGPAKGKRWQPPEGLSPADVQAIIDAAGNDRDRLLLRVLWATGGRISEALALRACDIQRDALILPNRKNPSQPTKRLFLPTGSLNLPGELLLWQKNQHLKDEEPLFWSRKKGSDGNKKAISRIQAWKIVKEAPARAGIQVLALRPSQHGNAGAPAPVHPHLFRHARVRQLEGMQRNQQVVFLTDDGDTLRDLPLYLNPESEHDLDWFHLAMRLTAMGQVAKGLGAKPEGLRTKALEQFESVKHYLWHGNLFEALQTLEDLELDVEGEEAVGPTVQKLARMVREFHGYLEANHASRRTFGEHWRHGETISTAFVASTVNAVVRKRCVKQQQRQWTERGAHLLLQMRVRVLDDDLAALFQESYPSFRPTMEDKLSA